MLPEISEEARRIIRDYVDAVDRKLDELGFVLEERGRRELLFNVENAMQLYSIKLAKKEGVFPSRAGRRGESY